MNGWRNQCHWEEQDLAIVVFPKEHKAIEVKWVYKTKYKANGSLDV